MTGDNIESLFDGIDCTRPRPIPPHKSHRCAAAVFPSLHHLTSMVFRLPLPLLAGRWNLEPKSTKTLILRRSFERRQIAGCCQNTGGGGCRLLAQVLPANKWDLCVGLGIDERVNSNLIRKRRWRRRRWFHRKINYLSVC